MVKRLKRFSNGCKPIYKPQFTNRLKGKLTEGLALVVLMLKGVRPLKGNVRSAVGETDILAREGDVLVLVEVKYRKHKENALWAVHPRQAERLKRQARHWLGKQDWAASVRLDLVIFYKKWPFVAHYKNVWMFD